MIDQAARPAPKKRFWGGEASPNPSINDFDMALREGTPCGEAGSRHQDRY
jgi:hypothetical protein